jgi:hypothetical protein
MCVSHDVLPLEIKGEKGSVGNAIGDSTYLLNFLSYRLPDSAFFRCPDKTLFSFQQYHSTPSRFWEVSIFLIIESLSCLEKTRPT